MNNINKNNKIELLAPAGNLEKMTVALGFGADAVYAGIPDFSLRVRINDFDMEKIKEATEICHKQNKKIYITINIFAHNRHFEKLPKYIKELKKIGIDALIASDPGVIMLIKKEWPKAEIHLSTQANCTNYESAKFWHETGVSRVILGREVTLEEIREIKKRIPALELEYFIHGAMCMAYSGRCFLSKYYLDRSANLGDCIQPCRWNYYISEEKRPDQPLELVEEEHGSYILNSKDLCLIEHLDELMDAGVSSFKIEGRAKSVYYQAVVVGIYREALNLFKQSKKGVKVKTEIIRLKNELQTKLVHRGYTTGFLLGGEAEQNINESHLICEWEYCGQVTETREGALVIKVHNSIKKNDTIEIVRPHYDIIKLEVKEMADLLTGEKISEAHGGQEKQILLKIDADIPVGAVIRRKIK